MSDGSFLRTEPLIRSAAETNATTNATAPPPVQASMPVPMPTPSGGGDQLARIEDKTARIEDKFARLESLIARMQATFEDVMNEFGSLARRNDMVAIQKRVRVLPGLGSLIVVAVVTAVLAAALTLGALKSGIVTIEPK